MRAIISGSRMPIILKCAPSGALPRVMRIGDRDRMGSALHEHMRDRAVHGVTAAFAEARLAEIAKTWELDEREASIFVARARGFEWNPPRGSLAEIALCLCDDGAVHMVNGGRGVYKSLPPGARLPTQIDLMWSEPEPLYYDPETSRPRCPPGSILWVLDYKSGKEEYVDAVERNAQTITGCVLAAAFTGATMAVPALCFIRKGKGLWDVPEHYLDGPALAQGKSMILNALDAVEDQRERLRLGEPLSYVVGSHCNYCDAQTYCVAKTAALKTYLDDPHALDAKQLTPLQAVKLAELLPSFARFADQAKEALKQYTLATKKPITLPNGKEWGPNPHVEKEIIPEVALAVLAEEFKDQPDAKDRARAILKSETSRAAIERVIKEFHAEQDIKRQAASAMRRIMAKLVERKGFRETTEIWFSTYDPAPKQLPAAGGTTETLIVEGDPA